MKRSGFRPWLEGAMSLAGPSDQTLAAGHPLALQVVAALNALVFAFNFCLEILVWVPLGRNHQVLILAMQLCLVAWALAETAILRARQGQWPLQRLQLLLLLQFLLEGLRLVLVLRGTPYGISRSYGIQVMDFGLLATFVPLYLLLFFGTSRALLRIHDHELALVHSRLTSLAVGESRRQEREMLLHEVHDGFGSQLASVRMMVERGHVGADQLALLLRELSADLHLVVDTLRQDDITLEESLHDMRYRIGQQLGTAGTQPDWTLTLDGMPPLPSRMLLQVLRIMQEALHNAMRHAQAQHIGVFAHWAADSGTLELRVQDDGVGMPEQARAGRGLANMRYRAREIGADFSMQPGHPGTVVNLRLGRWTPSPALAAA